MNFLNKIINSKRKEIIIKESSDKSTIDKNFKKKSGFKVFYEDDQPSILMATDKKYVEDIIKSLNESDSQNIMNLYFISANKNIKQLEPRIPNNFFTKNDYEDSKTPRVCFSTDIGKCLMALSMKCENMKFYVYCPIGNYKIISPTKKQVPDVEITNEKWICEKVNLICIGEILCIGDKGEDGIPYTYGKNNEHSAELYEWNWKWIKKYNISNISESVISNIQNDHKNDKYIQLFSLQRYDLNKENLSKYIDKYNFLKHIRLEDNIKGYIFTDKDNLVGVISVESKMNGENWIQGLEITKEYQNHGLSKQILKLAISTLKARFLSVNKKNEVAIKIYKDIGFKIYDESDTMYFMKL